MGVLLMDAAHREQRRSSRRMPSWSETNGFQAQAISTLQTRSFTVGPSQWWLFKSTPRGTRQNSILSVHEICINLFALAQLAFKTDSSSKHFGTVRNRVCYSWCIWQIGFDWRLSQHNRAALKESFLIKRGLCGQSTHGESDRKQQNPIVVQAKSRTFYK